MKLIADSGSTKTEWRIIDNEGMIFQARSSGINPYYQDSDTIKKEIEQGISEYCQKEFESIYFYGAGCSTEHNIKLINDALLAIFPLAKVYVNHDLLAAAHSLCGHESGIACILGTGSNSCFYDGEKITQNINSLGFIMGDEGSGNHLGKKLLSDFIRDVMPENIKSKLVKRYNLNKDEILMNVYQREMPAKYLAGFSKFIFQNLKDPYLFKLVYDAISTFFENHIMKYGDYKEQPVHFTGSVAFYYGNIVRKVAADKGVLVKHILESPIAGLTLYHQNV